MRSRCTTTRTQLERGFVERQLAPGEAAPLWNHLSRCGGCRAFYDDVVRLERLATTAGQSESEPSSWETELWTERVIRPATRRSRRAALGVLAAVGGLAAIAVITVRPPVDDALVHRGGHAPAVQIRAFCEERSPEGGARIRSLSPDAGPLETSRCPRDATVRFAYLADAPLRLFAQLRRADGPWVVAPDSESGWPLAAAGDLSPLPLVLPPGFADDGTHVDVAFFAVPLATTGVEHQRAQAEGVAPTLVRRIRFGQGPAPEESVP